MSILSNARGGGGGVRDVLLISIKPLLQTIYCHRLITSLYNIAVKPVSRKTSWLTSTFLLTHAWLGERPSKDGNSCWRARSSCQCTIYFQFPWITCRILNDVLHYSVYLASYVFRQCHGCRVGRRLDATQDNGHSTEINTFHLLDYCTIYPNTFSLSTTASLLTALRAGLSRPAEWMSDRIHPKQGLHTCTGCYDKPKGYAPNSSPVGLQ